MNNDLISRKAAIKMIRENGLRGEGYSREEREDNLVDMLECLPDVDAAPVVHGRWIDSNGAIRCSECLHTPLYDYHGRLKLSKACPTCGANMWKERVE